ncbi:MAG TPA: hypothetical protein PKN48_04030 [Bacteroidales bacterium]|nr:hypothetical protein [Bacteroidales bacterium]
MKRLLLFAWFVMLSAISAYSQQGVSINATGAPADPSAMLDVSSLSKGLLIPRVSLTSINDVTTIPSPAISLLVYNTNAAMIGGAVGFWYFDGTVWVQALGPQGIQGPTGAQGLQGIQGATGVQGIPGAPGVPGPVGPTGAQGLQGIQGPTGVQGVTGAQGIPGATGPQGIQGATGLQGIQGVNGNTGATGSVGPQGVTGAQGIPGATGPQGIQGATGLQGIQGVNGNTGATGATGPLVAGTNTQTLRHNGTTWVANSMITNNGTNVGVNASPYSGAKLYAYRPYGEFGSDSSAIFGYRAGYYGPANGGNSWSVYGVDAAIKGYNYFGNNYTAGIAGYSFLDYANSIALIGSDYSGYTWGGLAYKDDSSYVWAGYFNGNVKVAGSENILGNLAVTGNAKVGGTLTINGGAPDSNKVLISTDTVGNAVWQSIDSLLPAGTSTLPAGTSMQTLRHDGTSWVANNMITNNGTNVGVNYNPYPGAKLFAYRPYGNFGPDSSSIFAYRAGYGTEADGGTSWGVFGVDAAIKGYSDYGNNYSAGVAGYGYLDYPNSTALIGSNYSGTIWGALAYKDLAYSVWAGYFTGNVNVTGTLSIQGGTPGSGKVLTSDAAGNASWQTLASLLPAGTSGQTLRHDGTTWVANSNLFNNGSNVGIGTSTPAEKLDVWGGSSHSYMMFHNDYTTGSSLRGLKIGIRADGYPFIWSYENLPMYFGTNMSIRMTIAADGNVGIGSQTPGTLLDVEGGAIRTNNQLISTIPTGTSPLAVNSTTLNTNLNADMLDGLHASSFQTALSGTTNYNAYWASPTTLGSEQYVSVSRGGTGQGNALTTGGVIYAQAPTAMACTGAGTAGQVLKSNGAAAPAWSNNNGLIVTAETGATTSLTSTWSNYSGAVVTITAPYAGTIEVLANTWVRLDHALGTTDMLYLAIGTSPTDGGTAYNYVAYDIPSAIPSYSGSANNTFTVTRRFAVAAGTYTYYLNGYMASGLGAGDYFWFASMRAVFY